MINLYNELKKVHPDNETLLSYINDLDESQHNSWLVLRAKTFIKHSLKPGFGFSTSAIAKAFTADKTTAFI